MMWWWELWPWPFPWPWPSQWYGPLMIIAAMILCAGMMFVLVHVIEMMDRRHPPDPHPPAPRSSG
jgi:hypothetical protein